MWHTLTRQASAPSLPACLPACLHHSRSPRRDVKRRRSEEPPPRLPDDGELPPLPPMDGEGVEGLQLSGGGGEEEMGDAEGGPKAIELDAELTPEELMLMQQMGIPFVSFSVVDWVCWLCFAVGRLPAWQDAGSIVAGCPLAAVCAALAPQGCGGGCSRSSVADPARSAAAASASVMRRDLRQPTASMSTTTGPTRVPSRSSPPGRAGSS